MEIENHNLVNTTEIIISGNNYSSMDAKIAG